MSLKMVKIAKVEGNSLVKQTLCMDELFSQFTKEKKEFREKNGSKDIIAAGGRDLAYERLCEELDSLIINLMDDYHFCKKCKMDDHEGKFCHCESRNFRVAMKQRKEKYG